MKRSHRRRKSEGKKASAPKAERPGGLKIDVKIDENLIFIVRGSKTKQGWRKKFGQLQYAQVAIHNLYPRNLYPSGPPRSIDQSKLTTAVNDWLANNSDFSTTRRRPISRNTVLRALDHVWRSS
jgi:hypothetical protein